MHQHRPDAVTLSIVPDKKSVVHEANGQRQLLLVAHDAPEGASATDRTHRLVACHMTFREHLGVMCSKGIDLLRDAPSRQNGHTRGMITQMTRRVAAGRYSEEGICRWREGRTRLLLKDGIGNVP